MLSTGRTCAPAFPNDTGSAGFSRRGLVSLGVATAAAATAGALTQAMAQDGDADLKALLCSAGPQRREIDALRHYTDEEIGPALPRPG